MNTKLGSFAWHAEVEKERQQAQAEEQARIAHAQRMAAIPQDVHNAAMSEALELYKARMAQEVQKTEAQRKTEALQTELEGVTAQLQTYYKNHSQHKSVIPAVEKRFKELWAEIESLEQQPQPQTQPTNTVTFDNGSIY